MTSEDESAADQSDDDPSDSTALTLIQREGYDMEMIQRWGNLMYASGLFPDVKSMAQAAVKIMVGRELGFSVMASMSGVHLIDGKPVLGAGLMASALKESTKYDYDVKTHTDQACAIEVFEYVNDKKVSLGTSTFTIEDAETAQLLGRGARTWEKYPRNMLFSRAISNAIAWFAPDVFEQRIYTPEELGLPVGEHGDVIDAKVIPTSEPSEPATEPEKPGEATVASPKPSAPKTEPAATDQGGDTRPAAGASNVKAPPRPIRNLGGLLQYAAHMYAKQPQDVAAAFNLAVIGDMAKMVVADLAGDWERAVKVIDLGWGEPAADENTEDGEGEPAAPEPAAEPETVAEAEGERPDYLAQAGEASAVGDEISVRAAAAREAGDGDGRGAE